MEAVARSEHDAEIRKLQNSVTQSVYYMNLNYIEMSYSLCLSALQSAYWLYQATEIALSQSGQGDRNSATTTTEPIFFTLNTK